MSVRKLLVQFAVDSDEYKRGLMAIGMETERLGQKLMSSLGSGPAVALAATGAAALGAAAAVGQAIKVFDQHARALGNFAEELDKQRKITGLSFNTLQTLKKVAEESNVSFQGLARAASQLGIQLDKNNPAFQKLGLNLRELKTASPDEQLRLTAKALAGITDEGARNSIAMQLVGRQYRDLVVALDELTSATADFGQLTDEQMQSALSMDKAYDKLGTATEALSKQLTAVFMEGTGAADVLMLVAEGIGSVARFIRDNAGTITWFVGKLGAIGEFGRIARFFADDPTVKQNSIFEPGDGMPGMPTAAEKAAEAVRFKKLEEADKEREKRAKELLKAEKDRHDFEVQISDAMIEQVASMFTLEDAVKNVNKHAPARKAGTAAGMIASFEGTSLFKNASEAMRLADAKRITMDVVELTFDWGTALQGVALVAGALGGAFGDVLQIVGNIGEQFKGWKTMDAVGKIGAVAGGVGMIGGLIGKKHAKTGGFLQGAAGGAMTGAALGSVIPGVGTAIGGVAGGIIGGIAGLFGGGKKAKEEKAAREQAFAEMEANLKEQFGSLSRLDDIAKRYGVDLKKALASRDAEKLNKELAALQKKQEGLAKAGSGIVALVQSFKPATEQGAMAQAGLFSTVFWATVQREGLAVAAETMQPAFDKLMEGASESMKTFLAPIGQQMALAGDEAFKSAAAGAAALGQTISGMMDAGIVSINDLRNAGVVAMEQYNAALGAAQAEGLDGAAAQEAAIRAVGPAVAELLAGYTALGIPLDENAMALQAAAEATGMMFPQDAMTRAAESMERVALALEHAFGLSTGIADNMQRAGNVRFPEMPNYSGGTGEGGGGTETLPVPDEWGNYAKGGITNAGRGMPAMLHGREAIIPLDGPAPRSALAAVQAAHGGGGGSNQAGLAVNANFNIDPLQSNAAREDLAQYVIKTFVQQASGSPLMRKLLRENGGR